MGGSGVARGPAQDGRTAPLSPPGGASTVRALPRVGVHPPRSRVRPAQEAAPLGAPLPASAASGAKDSVRTLPTLPSDAGPQTSQGFLPKRPASRKSRKSSQAAGNSPVSPPGDTLWPSGCFEGRHPSLRCPPPRSQGNLCVSPRFIRSLFPYTHVVPRGGRPP